MLKHFRTLVLRGFDRDAAARLAEMLDRPHSDELTADALLCIGPELRGHDAVTFLERHENVAIVLAAGDDVEAFQDLVDADRIYFLSRRPPPLSDVAALIRSALTPRETALGKAVTEIVRRIAAETDLTRLGALLGEAAAGLTDATHGRFAFYDRATETLWSGGDTRNSVASGLAGFALRTGTTIAALRIGDDPRYDADADNDGRSPRERFLAVPMAQSGVFLVTRDEDAEPFGDVERAQLALLASEAGPFVRQRAQDEGDGPLASDGEPLYRAEALQAYLEGAGGPGRVLEMSDTRLGRDDDARGERRSWFRRKERRIPFFQQTTKADCGPACLSMVLAFHGKHVPLRDLRETLGAARDGADARQILTGAEWYGLRGRAVKVDDVESLDYLPAGSILHWQFRHFVVLERTTRDGAWIVDPAAGRRFVSWTELRAAFTGIALTLEPSAHFQPESARKSGAARYVRQLIRESPLLARIVGVSILLQILALALPFLTGLVVDRVVPRRDVNLLTILAAGLAGVVGFHFLTTLLRARLLLRLRVQLDSRMTLGFLEHLIELPYAFFQQRSTGDLMARLSSNAVVREILTSGALSGALDGMLVSLYLIVVVAVHPILGLLVLTLGALRVLLFLALRKRHQELMSRALQAEAASRGYQVEMLAGIETLKSLGAERRAVEHWSSLFADELNVVIARGRLSATFDSLLAALSTASPFVILVYGALEVIRGQLTLGTMLAVSALAAGFFAPLTTLVQTALQVQLLGSYFERIDDVLDAPPEQDRTVPLARPALRGRITVDRVSFRYHAAAPLVIDDVSIEVPPGSFVALVGPSGAGKTTLAHLMAGLYRPTTGRILYDGADLAGLDVRHVRSQLGIVNQQPYLFGGSIASNIGLADPTLPRARLVEAARLAHIHADVEAMPLGYETLLGDGGLTLSGGQRQRLALARALVHRPAILLLDEATSSLDTATERSIQEELAALHCTRIVIAHRLSTVRAADLILVMDQGRVVERGRHDELIESGGRYGALVAVQMRA